MKYCTECGQCLTDGAEYCSKCGVKQPSRNTEQYSNGEFGTIYINYKKNDDKTVTLSQDDELAILKFIDSINYNNQSDNFISYINDVFNNAEIKCKSDENRINNIAITKYIEDKTKYIVMAALVKALAKIIGQQER